MNYKTVLNLYQAPFNLFISATLSGFLSPEPDKSFNYCMLFCREAYTLNALALLNPQSNFIGIEPDQKLIKEAKNIAQQLNLKNITYIKANIRNLKYDKFPDFDFIILNTSYSHLKNSLREKIFDFVNKKLKEGGIFYIEYLSLPGNASIIPFWYLFQKLIPAEKFSDLKERAKKGLYFLKLFAKRGMFYFRDHLVTTKLVQFYLNQIQTDECDEFILDHFIYNMLSNEFKPFFFYEIYESAKNKGLVFIGSADFKLNDLELSVPFSHIPTFFEITETSLAETLKDFIRNASERKDMFSKNPIKDYNKAYQSLKEKIKIFPTVPITEIIRVVPVIGGGRIPLKAPIYDKIFQLFENKREFITLKDIEEFPPKQILKALIKLLATNEFILTLEEPAQFFSLKYKEIKSFKFRLKFNQMLLEKACEKFWPVVFISELTRSPFIYLNPLEAIILLNMQKHNKNLVEKIKENLSHISKVVPTLSGSKPAKNLKKEEIEKFIEIFCKRKLSLLIKTRIIEI